jgi:3-hydroxyacyl-CoA dehydrogenase
MQRAGRLKADVDGAGIATADLIIEAIFENLEAKQALFKRLETEARPEAVLASNTSSIPLQDIASALKQPGRLIGLHFFNPVAMMPLVEVVRHTASSADSLERASGFARSLDKLPVPVASAPGFLVNRILMPYLLEAMTLYAEGVPGPVIDKAAVRWGMPMGPIELADTVGLDVAASVGKILAEFLSLPVPKGLEGLLESGKRGKKDGQGFYLWEDGKAKKPEVDEDYVAPEDLTRPSDTAHAQRVGCLSGRKSRGFARAPGRRRDLWNGLCALPRRPMANHPGRGCRSRACPPGGTGETSRTEIQPAPGLGRHFQHPLNHGDIQGHASAGPEVASHPPQGSAVAKPPSARDRSGAGRVSSAQDRRSGPAHIV